MLLQLLATLQALPSGQIDLKTLLRFPATLNYLGCEESVWCMVPLQVHEKVKKCNISNEHPNNLLEEHTKQKTLPRQTKQNRPDNDMATMG